ncbi:hypothetical protein [Pseudarthrobacter sp. BIM B-2242]|uniref:hypothetical protein n=1 Tax=Pseudarthrobacter sp. BIM B-2242 TaxID=2772401 RepID=UPI00168C0E02|nr:hypothetical protein [Pseudarthrobacter sp. BIM B-2242]QOD06024.1 hypothetical protein IDT60_20890 [Pseudarthrobacter sp. BIM B-2242]
MKTFRGHVQAPEYMFSTEDGKTVFRPINDHYATVRPGDAAPRSTPFGTGLAGLRSPDPVSVEFDRNDGEFFQVREEIDKSEGRMGTKPAGNFLDYAAAYTAAAGKNAQGGRGAIVIMSPSGHDDITAVDANGETVLIEPRTRWSGIDLSSRLRFPDRDA